MPRTIALLAALCLSLPAQEARQRTGGVVLDKSGQPWAGARVVLVSGCIPWDESSGLVDRVEAVTDADGRFHAKLLLLRGYSAWAEQAPDRASEALEGVAAGQTLRLVEAEQRNPVALVLEGAEAWAAHGRLWVRAVASTANHTSLLLEPDARGRHAMPLLPGNQATLEVRLEPSLLVVHRERIPLTDAVSPAERIVRLPPPLLAKVRVEEGGTRLPLSGIVLRTPPPGTSQGSEVELGTTAADGVCSFPWPLANGRTFQGAVAAFGPEHGETLAQLRLEPDGSASALLGLPRQPALRGRLLRRGAPLANQRIVLESGVMAGRVASARVFRTAKDGTFVLPAPRSAQTVRLAAPLEPSDQVELAGGPKHAPCWPEAFLLLHPARSGPLAPQLGDIDLAKLHRLELTLRQADGTPVSYGEVAILPPTGSPPIYLRRLTTTRQAQLTLLLAPGTWSLGHIGPNGHALLEVEVSDASPARQEIDLRLTAPHMVYGRVVNDRGELLAGASLGWILNTSNRSPELGRLWTIMPSLRTTSGEDGTFRIWVPAEVTSLEILAQVTRGGVRYAPDTPISFAVGEPSEPAAPLTVTIPQAPQHDGG